METEFVEEIDALYAKATKGPWMARINHFSRWEILDSRGILAQVCKHDDPASPPPIDEIEPNARIIVALFNAWPTLRALSTREAALGLPLDMPEDIADHALALRTLPLTDESFRRTTGKVVDWLLSPDREHAQSRKVIEAK